MPNAMVAAGILQVQVWFMPLWTQQAVHTGTEAVHVMRQTLTGFEISASAIDVLEKTYFPNQNWLLAIERTKQQQLFLSAKLDSQEKPFLIFPSVVSPKSGCVIFKPMVAKGQYALIQQEQFSLDPRLSFN
jgi:RES domain-containing protein